MQRLPTWSVPVLDERILSQPAFNPSRGRSEGGPVITKSRQHLWPIESAAWTDLPMGLWGPIPSISLTRTDSTPCYWQLKEALVIDDSPYRRYRTSPNAALPYPPVFWSKWRKYFWGGALYFVAFQHCTRYHQHPWAVGSRLLATCYESTPTWCILAGGCSHHSLVTLHRSSGR